MDRTNQLVDAHRLITGLGSVRTQSRQEMLGVLAECAMVGGLALIEYDGGTRPMSPRVVKVESLVVDIDESQPYIIARVVNEDNSTGIRRFLVRKLVSALAVMLA